jgi:two-component system cell cycle sensor histidine kinase/response regulator CckA
VGTILVVDDEGEILRLVESILTRQGHRVITAPNGDRALEKVKKLATAPDLLLSDIVMPGLSGPMLADQLRAKYPEMRVLFMSAYEDRQIVRRFVKDPGFALISKPFHNNDLTNKVKELLEGAADAVGGGS